MSTAPGPPRSSRLAKTAKDMAISLAVLAVPLVLLMAFCRPVADDVPTVDATSTYRAAAAAAPYDVRVPQPLPSGWRSTNAALRSEGGVTLRVSYLTPGGRYVQLLQSNRPADELLREELDGGKRRGAETISGAQWQRYGGRRDGEMAFVLLEPTVTVVVVGDAPPAQLTALIATLR